MITSRYVKTFLVSTCFIYILFLLEILAQDYPSNTALTCKDIHTTPQFLSDSCCTRESERRQCLDTAFCTGVTIAHPSSFLSQLGCCSEYSSCQDTKQLFDTLNNVRKLTWVDFSFSCGILTFIAIRLFNRDQQRPYTLVTIVLEVADLVINLTVVINVVQSSALETANNIMKADCFTTGNDAGIIHEVIGQLENFYLIAIVEACIDLLLVVVHIVELRSSTDGAIYTSTATSGYILDIGEFISSVINLFVLLIPAIQNLELLHNSMVANVADSNSSVGSMNEPCMFSCCLQHSQYLTSNPSVSISPSSPTSYPSIAPSSIPDNTPINLSRENEIKLLLINKGVTNSTALETPNSPQWKSLKWIANIDCRQVPISSQQELIERYVLSVLYFGTNGPCWEKLSHSSSDKTSWLSATHICDWKIENPKKIGYDFGVRSCNKEKSVQILKLFSNDLQGTIPSELGSLENLTEVDFGFNQFYGTLPKELGRLSSLEYLALHVNIMLEGTIPKEWGGMVELKYLWLDGNDLSGDFPKSICSNVEDKKPRVIETDCSTTPLKISCDCCTKCHFDNWGKRVTRDCPNNSPNMFPKIVSGNCKSTASLLSKKIHPIIKWVVMFNVIVW